MSEKKLVGRRELGEKHPYLSNRWRLNYLIRSGQLAGVVRVGKKALAFDLEAINKWIEQRTRAEVSE